jgi:general secretion pathway protein L
MNKTQQTFIWLPPRSIGERAFLSEMSLIVMTVNGAPNARNAKKSIAPSQANARYVRSSLEALDGVKAVTLILDARDVTLLRASLPALSGAKLAKALPNVVEDMLLQDVAACALVIGPKFEGSADSMVGVVDRAWLDLVVSALERQGLKVLGAVPAQLVLPLQGEAGGSGTSLAVACYQNGLAIRTDQFAGFGWGAGEDPDFKGEALSSALLAARQSTGAHDPDVSLYIENEDWEPSARKVLEQAKLRATIGSLPIPQFDHATIDFLGERSGTKGGRFLGGFEWRAWRVPAMVLAGAAACYLLGLNLHWGHLAQEKTKLKAEAERRFMQAFPQTQVVVDPLLQMQRNVSTLRAQAGQSGPEDFVPLAAKLSSALAQTQALTVASGPVRAAEAIQSIEFRATKLRVKFITGLADNRANREAILATASRFALKFEFETDNTLVVGALQ